MPKDTRSDEERTRDWLARVIAARPPLTPTQRRRIVYLLNPPPTSLRRVS